MKLSILIPMYNAEPFIERCLSSLIHQSMPKHDYEVIVFNDGSKDSSKSVVENFIKTHDNVFLYSHKNEGVISTRNKLLKLAKGTYVHFMDADDYIAYDSLKGVLDFALQNVVDIIGFNTLVTKDEASFNLKISFEDIEIPEIVSGAQYLKENKNLRLEIWWFLVRKDFLISNKFTFVAEGYDGDVVFTLQLFLHAKKVAYTPISIYRYFQSTESTMRNKDHTSRKRIALYFLALIDDLSNLIDTLESLPISHKSIIKSHFKDRKSVV